MSWKDIAHTAVIVVMLGLCLWRAVRTFRRRGAESGRLVRLTVAGCVFAGVMTVQLAMDRVGSASTGPQPLFLPFVAAILGVAVAMLILLIELLLWRLRPARSLRRLVFSPCLFLPVFFAPFVLPLWITTGNLDRIGVLGSLQLAAMVIATALVWWSYLPVVGDPVARRFA